VIGGDFNVDFSNSVLSQLLIDTCTDNLRIATLHECCDIDFKYNLCMNRFSFIYHFILLPFTIAGCTVRHDGDNLSDHDPIIGLITLNIDWNSIALTKRNTVARAALDRASHRDIAEYKHTLQDILNSVLPPSESLACHDIGLLYSDKQPITQLNSYSNQIIRVCLESAASTITSTSRPTSGARNVLPGWNEHVLPAREKSILAYGIMYG